MTIPTLALRDFNGLFTFVCFIWTGHFIHHLVIRGISVSTCSVLHCGRFTNPIFGLGHAVELLKRVQPFASYDFGTLSSVLMGQIKREHYAFTFDGKMPVGYAGWALCDEAIARAWIEERYVPTFAECLSGDSWVGITFYARTKRVCLYQARWCRTQYPGLKAFGIRDYGHRNRKGHATNRPQGVAAEVV